MLLFLKDQGSWKIMTKAFHNAAKQLGVKSENIFVEKASGSRHPA